MPPRRPFASLSRAALHVAALALLSHPASAQGTKAPPDSIRLRYRPIAQGDFVMTHVQQRIAQRLRFETGDDRRPHFTESAYYGLRTASYDTVRADGRRTVDYRVFADELREGEFGKQVPFGTTGRYTVELRGDSVAVAPRDAGIADSALRRVRASWSGRSSHEMIGELLHDRPFVSGATHRMPQPLLDLVGATAGTFAFAGLETRWQRQVALFRLVAESAEPLEYRQELTGELRVDVLTGRPLQLSVVGSGANGDGAMFEGKRLTRAGTSSVLRAWGYSAAAVPMAGQGIEVVPQTAPNGPIRSLAVSADGRTLAMQTADRQLAFWDLPLRRTTSVVPVEASHVAFAASMLFALDHVGFVRTWSAGVDAKAFGRSDRDIEIGPDAIGLAMAGFYPVTAYENGHVSVRNPGWGRVVGSFRADPVGLKAIATSDSGTLLAAVDTRGRLTLRTLRIGTEGCDGDWRTAWCERATLMPPTVVASAAPGWTDVASLAVHPAGTHVAASTGGGDVYVWTRGTGDVRRIDGAGRRIVFSRDGRELFTERGRYALASGTATLRFGASTTDDPDDVADLHIAVTPGEEFLFRSRERRGDARERHLVEIVDLRSGAVLEEIRSRTRPVVDARLETGDGVGIAVRTDEGARTWDLADLEIRADTAMSGLAGVDAVLGFAGTAQGVAAIVGATVQPGSGTLAGTLSNDGTLRVWDTVRRAELLATSLDIHRPSARERAGARVPLALSSDGRTAAVAYGRDTTRVWNREIPLVLLVDVATGRLAGHLVPRWGTTTALAFSPDGRRLLAGDEDGGVIVYDVRSGTIASEFRAHDTEVTRVGFLSGDDRYFTASLDGTLRIWRADDPGAVAQPSHPVVRILAQLVDRPTHLVATLVAVDSAERVVATAEGYYLASRGALRAIAFVRGDKAFDFEQYDLWLNRPDVVLERLGLTDDDRLALYRAATARRQGAGGVRTTLADAMATPPTLEVAAAPPPFTSAPAVALDLVATPGPAPLRRLHVRVNSVPLDSAPGRPLAGAAWSGKVQLPLSHGVNRIQLSVVDARGVESARRTLVVTRTGPAPRPDLYVLAIGVSDYADDRLDLRYAEKDAGDIAQLFASDTARYARVHVRRIPSREATRRGILAARAFLEQARVDDEVIVFFAGHGFLDRKLDYYFGTTDVDPKAPHLAGLDYASLVGLLDGIPSRRRLLLLDTCHAGEVDREAPPVVASTPAGTLRVRELRGFGVSAEGTARGARGASSFELMRELFADLRAQSGVVVLSAAGGAEYAMESSEWANGAFTYSILEAVQRLAADTDGDHHVSVSELERYVGNRVVQLTRGGQRPTARQRNVDVDFRIR